MPSLHNLIPKQEFAQKFTPKFERTTLFFLKVTDFYPPPKKKKFGQGEVPYLPHGPSYITGEKLIILDYYHTMAYYCS